MLAVVSAIQNNGAKWIHVISLISHSLVYACVYNTVCIIMYIYAVVECNINQVLCLSTNFNILIPDYFNRIHILLLHYILEG